METADLPYSPCVQSLDGDCTIVSLEFRGERELFSVTGMAMPYEVSYLHKYGLRGGERSAWFDIAPERALEPAWFEEHVYPLLIELHERRLQDELDAELPEGERVRVLR